MKHATSYHNRLMVKSSRIVKAIEDGKAITGAKEGVENEKKLQEARFDEITDSYLAECVQNLLRSIDRIIKACGYRLQFLYREQKNLETNHK